MDSVLRELSRQFWVVTQIATGTFTVTGTVTRFNVQIAIPAAATTGIQITFAVGAQTSGTWTIGNVQLEAGSVATAFQTATGNPASELAACQRYYWRAGGDTATQPFGQGNAATATTSYIVVISPVTMRSKPTSVDWSTLNVSITGISAKTITNITIADAGRQQQMLAVTVAANDAAGTFQSIQANSSLAAYLGLSAEL